MKLFKITCFLILLSSCRTVLVKGTDQNGNTRYFEAYDSKERAEILYFKPHWLFKFDTIQTEKQTPYFIKIDTVYSLN